MIKEVVKALIGVGKFPEEEFQPSLLNILAFGFLLIFSFLSAVASVAFIVSLFIT